MIIGDSCRIRQSEVLSNVSLLACLQNMGLSCSSLSSHGLDADYCLLSEQYRVRCVLHLADSVSQLLSTPIEISDMVPYFRRQSPGGRRHAGQEDQVSGGGACWRKGAQHHFCQAAQTPAVPACCIRACIRAPQNCQSSSHCRQERQQQQAACGDKGGQQGPTSSGLPECGPRRRRQQCACH